MVLALFFSLPRTQKGQSKPYTTDRVYCVGRMIHFMKLTHNGRVEKGAVQIHHLVRQNYQQKNCGETFFVC